MEHPKFIQIVPSSDWVFGLTETGEVWEYRRHYADSKITYAWIEVKNIVLPL